MNENIDKNNEKKEYYYNINQNIYITETFDNSSPFSHYNDTLKKVSYHSNDYEMNNANIFSIEEKLFKLCLDYNPLDNY